MADETEKQQAKAYYKRKHGAYNPEQRKKRLAEQAAKYQAAQEEARKEAERQRLLRANLDQGRTTQHLNRVRKRYTQQGEHHEPEKPS